MKRQKRKIFFELGPNAWHGFETESLWAETVSASRYKLANTPFFAKGVSFEDVVFVKKKEGLLYYKSTSILSGRSTYRIIPNTDVDFDRAWEPLSRLGCTYENSSRGIGLIAVDVPQSANIYEAYSFLEWGENEGIWSFEEGHCGHTL